MTDLILYIVKNLVTNPDAVSVEEQSNGGQVDLLLTVDPVDMGLVIGKGGQTIKAIRKVLIVKAMADNVRVNLQLAEPAGGRPPRESEDLNIGKSEEAAEDTEETNEVAPAEVGTPETTESEEVEAPEPVEQPTEKPKKSKKA